MSALPAFPTLREELDRKSFETLDWLFTALDNGKLTPAQFNTGIDTLFGAVSGLVDDEIFDLITAADSVAKKEKAEIKRVFIKGENVLNLARHAGGDIFAMSVWTKGVLSKSEIIECDSSKAAMERMDKFADSIIAKGYQEI